MVPTTQQQAGPGRAPWLMSADDAHGEVTLMTHTSCATQNWSGTGQDRHSTAQQKATLWLPLETEWRKSPKKKGGAGPLS